jgi:hypothetical protein
MQQLALAEVKFVDAQPVTSDVLTGMGEAPMRSPAPIDERHLAGDAERIAARASTSTRRSTAASRAGSPPGSGWLRCSAFIAGRSRSGFIGLVAGWRPRWQRGRLCSGRGGQESARQTR